MEADKSVAIKMITTTKVIKHSTLLCSIIMPPEHSGQSNCQLNILQLNLVQFASKIRFNQSRAKKMSKGGSDQNISN